MMIFMIQKLTMQSFFTLITADLETFRRMTINIKYSSYLRLRNLISLSKALLLA